MRQKRKIPVPFKLSIVFAVIAVVLVVANIITSSFAGTINTVLKIKAYEIISDEDGRDAEYYKSSFASKEELVAYGDQLVEEVEKEGAVLMMNNGALPLAAGAKVSLFSTSTVNVLYGGSGSGKVDSSKAPSMKKSFEDAGYTVNPTLWEFYKSGEASSLKRGSSSLSGMTSGTAIAEAPWSMYTSAVKSSFSSYGDAAIVLFSRTGGEGADLAYTAQANYLELDANEREMLHQVKALKDSGTFKSIVVIINSANALEVDFLFDEAYGVDACIWAGIVGQTGMNAIAKLLNGIYNPSGRLVDVYAKDNLTGPWMPNFGDIDFVNAASSYFKKYVVYQEGIYVGYRYYETRYEDAVMGAGNTAGYQYDADVAYTFGHGLSYTTFETSGFTISEDADGRGFTASVTVKNTGTVSGKQVVQLYFQSPYTDYDKANGIEKAAVELCGFAKTQELKPGESETVTIQVSKEELRSYDARGAKGYILDAGDYYFTVADNAHAAVNNVLAAKGYTPENAAGRMDAVGDADQTWKWTVAAQDNEIFKTQWATGAEITNQFDDADLSLLDTSGTNDFKYLSRSDWNGTFPKATLAVTVTADMESRYGKDRAYSTGSTGSAVMPKLGESSSSNTAVMIQGKGKAFDDPVWDRILNKVTFDEMSSLISDGFHHTIAIESIVKPATKDDNGPCGFTAAVVGGEAGTAYPSADLRSATWNTELARRIGEGMGDDCLYYENAGLYGTGANFHRSPYSGRNFEYYAADSCLGGQIGAAETAGIRSKGVYTMTKHFALNDQESNRSGVCTFSNEQAIREIYLAIFEKIIVENGDGAGVMTSYNRVGLKWSGGHIGLIRGVLRGEWQSLGIAISDSGGGGYMDGVDAVIAGSDIFDSMGSTELIKGFNRFKSDPVVVNAMREATHRILYTQVNSSAMNGISESTHIVTHTPWWQIVLVTATVLMAVLGVLFAVLGFLRKQKDGTEAAEPQVLLTHEEHYRKRMMKLCLITFVVLSVFPLIIYDSMGYAEYFKHNSGVVLDDDKLIRVIFGALYFAKRLPTRGFIPLNLFNGIGRIVCGTTESTALSQIVGVVILLSSAAVILGSLALFIGFIVTGKTDKGYPITRLLAKISFGVFSFGGVIQAAVAVVLTVKLATDAAFTQHDYLAYGAVKFILAFILSTLLCFAAARLAKTVKDTENKPS